jgi:hypothetical protein
VTPGPQTARPNLGRWAPGHQPPTGAWRGPQIAIAVLFGVRPETINERIRDIRQLLDQAGHAIQSGPHRLASLEDLHSLATAAEITVPPEIKTSCQAHRFGSALVSHGSSSISLTSVGPARGVREAVGHRHDRSLLQSMAAMKQ